MTVQTEDRIVEYVGDGASDNFAFNYVTLETSHIKVFIEEIEIITGFTTTLNVDQDAAPGGTVLFDTPPVASVIISINRTVPLTQETNYTPYNAFPAESHERALDKLTMQMQQINPGTSDLTGVFVLLNGDNNMTGDLTIVSLQPFVSVSSTSSTAGFRMQFNGVDAGDFIATNDDRVRLRKFSSLGAVTAELDITDDLFSFVGAATSFDNIVGINSSQPFFTANSLSSTAGFRLSFNGVNAGDFIATADDRIRLRKFDSGGTLTAELDIANNLFSFLGGEIAADGDITVSNPTAQVKLDGDGSNTVGLDLKQNGVTFSKLQVAADNNFYLQKFSSGGTVEAQLVITPNLFAFTGGVLSSDTAPTDVDHLTRKDYVDTVVANMQAQIDALQAQVNAL